MKSPTLLVHAREDDAASPRSAFEVASGVSSQRVNFVLLEDSYHMISIDKEKARVLSEMKDFLQGADASADSTARGAPIVTPTTTRSSEHVRA